MSPLAALAFKLYVGGRQRVENWLGEVQARGGRGRGGVGGLGG